MDILAALAADPRVDPALRQILAGKTGDEALPARRAAYVSALLRCDWTFEASDDQRAWRAGRNELTRLRAERAIVDPDGALWKKHAHRDYQHEVRS